MIDAAIPSLEFQRLQPVVLRAGAVWVPGSAGAGAIVTPTGESMPLRRFCPVTALAGHTRRDYAAALLADTVGGASAPLQDARALAVFIGAVVAGLAQWDAKGASGAPLPAGIAAAPATLPEVARLLPEPALPQPSLLLFGRYWVLGPCAAGAALQVLVGGERLGLTGTHRSVSQVTAEWLRVAGAVLRSEWRRRSTDSSLPGVAAALDELRSRGAVERGDLLFVAGNAPLLGHMLPEHGRSLAICAPLTSPIQVPPGVLVVYRRSGDRWYASDQPNGVCMGAAPGPAEWGQALCPAVSLALFLRFAAVRFAANGKFHERD